MLRNDITPAPDPLGETLLTPPREIYDSYVYEELLALVKGDQESADKLWAIVLRERIRAGSVLCQREYQLP